MKRHDERTERAVSRLSKPSGAGGMSSAIGRTCCPAADLTYAMNRQANLEVLLSDPDAPIYTNHLEWDLRPIPIKK